MVDLETMSKSDLERHLNEVQKALSTAETRNRKKAIKAAEAAVAEFGYVLADLSDEIATVGRKRKGTGSSAPAKYRNPADHTQTWTGKGRQPQWFKDAMVAGTDPSELEL